MKLLLTDFYNDATKRLADSFVRSKMGFVHVNIYPEAVLLRQIYCPFFTDRAVSEKKLYFNQISVPQFYEIRHENENGAKILRGEKQVGRVNYVSSGNRLVKRVDWWSDSARTVLSEHYDASGEKSFEDFFGDSGQVQKTIFYQGGSPVTSWDRQSGAISLFENQKWVAFSSLVDFTRNFIKNLPFEFDEIIYNSLSTSCFVALKFSQFSSLYFQEPIEQAIPGNMQVLLQGQQPTRRIFFEDEKTLEKVKKKAESSQISLDYLGNVEFFRRENRGQRTALTLTWSDEILYASQIARFPELLWTIATPTEASPRLKKFVQKNENVSLIEHLNLNKLDEYLENFDFYLDLNQGSEVAKVVERAYFEGMIVLTERSVAKNETYSLVSKNEQELLELWAEKPKNLLQKLHEKRGEVMTATSFKEKFDK